MEENLISNFPLQITLMKFKLLFTININCRYIPLTSDCCLPMAQLFFVLIAQALLGSENFSSNWSLQSHTYNKNTHVIFIWSNDLQMHSLHVSCNREEKNPMKMKQKAMDYGRTKKPFFIKIPNFVAWIDHFGVFSPKNFRPIYQHTFWYSEEGTPMFSINQPLKSLYIPIPNTLLPGIWIWVAKN